MRRLPAASLLFLLLALAGCGDGGEGTTTSATAPPAKQGVAPPAQGRAFQGNQKGTEANPGEVRQHTAEGAPVPGAKAVAPGVPVTKGGDNSIQSFGAEGEEGQRQQALAGLRSYLSALRAGKWAQACALASTQFKRELAKLVAQAKGKEKPKGCAATLQALLGGSPRAALGEAAQAGELLSFRVEGRYAYLIFRGAQGKAMFIAMANDEGKWKVNVLKPEPFGEASKGTSR
jgi:hypothetical protein